MRNAGDVNGDGYVDLIVGAPLTDVAAGETTLTDAGSAILYYGSASGLTEAGHVTLDGSQAGEQFGPAVAEAGDVNGDGYADIAVSALFYDTQTATDAGGVRGVLWRRGWSERDTLRLK